MKKQVLVLISVLTSLCVLLCGCTDPANIDTLPQSTPTHEATSQPTTIPDTEPETTSETTPAATQPTLRPNDTPFA